MLKGGRRKMKSRKVYVLRINYQRRLQERNKWEEKETEEVRGKKWATEREQGG